MNAANQLNNTIQLPDGRDLGFAIDGEPDGYPVLFFHGIPGSRLQRNPDPATLAGLGICIYALDRPGIGLSTAKSDRTLLSWTDDVIEFCRQMNFERFAVAGVSGGGPYALACAWRFPEKISHVTIISGIGPLAEPAIFSQLKPNARKLFQFAKNQPMILAPLLTVGLKLFHNQILEAFNWLTGELPASDQALLKSPEITRMLQEDVQQAFRAGSGGVLTEIQVLMEPWGFAPGAIKIPVDVWHGTDDNIVPISMAKYLLGQLVDARSYFIPAGGHFIALEKTRSIFSFLNRESGEGGEK